MEVDEMTKKNLYFVGGNGHLKSVLDVAKTNTDFKIAGYFNNLPINLTDSAKYLGTDDVIKKYLSINSSVHISLGFINSAKTRLKLIEKVCLKIN